jgi:hypothetical protein
MDYLLMIRGIFIVLMVKYYRFKRSNKTFTPEKE